MGVCILFVIVVFLMVFYFYVLIVSWLSVMVLVFFKGFNFRVRVLLLDCSVGKISLEIVII